MIPGNNDKPGYWRGRGRSFKYAFEGIRSLFGREPNAQFHLGASVAVIAAGFLLGISPYEWIAIVLCIAGMFMAEGFNTAIEDLCDFVCKEHDPRIGRVKDISAGAVLLMAIASVIVGLIIFLPKIIDLFAR